MQLIEPSIEYQKRIFFRNKYLQNTQLSSEQNIKTSIEVSFT